MHERLLEPINLGPTQIKNRIFNPPHGTTLSNRGAVTEDLIAYHEARAKGGVGLIILEGMTLHPSYGFEEAFLYAGDDKVIPGLRRLGDACRRHGTKLFGQLFHAGRAVRLSHDGSRPLAYSASDVPDERYRVTPVPMPNAMVWEIIDSYARSADRLAQAGLDGVEILASMGYLISQFLNPLTNHREDEFGGSAEKRQRFLKEILTRTRDRIGATKTLGIRVTLDEKTDGGLTTEDMIAICRELEADEMVDYFSVISGSSASPAGWIHVFPPMAVPHAFVADDAARLKQTVSKPILVAGRINQPQTAEQILIDGKADMVGMVRALITDPEFVNKVSHGESEQIHACVGCNQACVGHRLAHHPISCIQNPRTGRENQFNSVTEPLRKKKVLVIGGGPAGMRAAVTAAERGHAVSLYEKQGRLGGQVNLAERLPGRAEFGGVTTNLVHQLNRLSIPHQVNTSITRSDIESSQSDVIILATGAHPRLPDVEVEDTDLIDAWSVIRGEAVIGQNVVIADWSCDWSGLGVAQKLAQDGHHIRLVSGATIAGESIQGIVRDHWIGELHRLEVEMIPYARFFGADKGTVYFQHTISGEPIIFDQIDTIVSCFAPQSSREFDWLVDESGHEKHDFEVHQIGDAMAPRTVEEAVLEGFKIAMSL
ncbi:MAG: FAD-dependent oxidoreductase [bacterium]